MKHVDVIERLQRIRNFYWDTIEDYTAVEAVDMAISALKKQEADRWIPVTERLPEEDGRYLITEKTDGTKVQEGYFCRTRDGEPYWGYLHVTAWRPLPEPYTEKKND